MTKVYIVQIQRWKDDSLGEYENHGVYATKDLATQAIDAYQTKQRFFSFTRIVPMELVS
jgi:hypothetical protein